LMFINMDLVQKVLQWFCIEMKITGNDVCFFCWNWFLLSPKKDKILWDLICIFGSFLEMNNLIIIITIIDCCSFFLKQKVSILLDFRMGRWIVQFSEHDRFTFRWYYFCSMECNGAYGGRWLHQSS
jgi:hypothetical protein